MKKISNKAFTLIELMIVVVILWVLMSTVLPKLTWAQARSRDAWRIADLWNIAAALQVYYDDNWIYPWETNWSWACLDSTRAVWTWLTIYLQSQQVPVDPQPTANSYLCSAEGDKWKYFYAPVVKDWLDRNWYVLCADMETLQKANTDAGDLDSTWNWLLDNWTDTHNYSSLLPLVWNKDYWNTEDPDWANQSVYCMLRP